MSRNEAGAKSFAGHTPGPWEFETKPGFLEGRCDYLRSLDGMKSIVLDEGLVLMSNGFVGSLRMNVDGFMVPIRQGKLNADMALIVAAADPVTGLVATLAERDRVDAERDRLARDVVRLAAENARLSFHLDRVLDLLLAPHRISLDGIRDSLKSDTDAAAKGGE